MAIDVAQKVVTGDSQPNGGDGIVGVAGAKGLTAAEKIDSDHSVSTAKSSSLIEMAFPDKAATLADVTRFKAS